ncbi:sensor histidine kinase [Niabella soli]|uniref:histidine kinase n=1 Tax=Niabella soli DSM 19437 TaxID=929713 RepID=W0ET62_9BACT|nr:7TM diverse intracellular signaling domain-containing protein [Niabella soli]AHF14020.1 phosphate starvation-inducible protein PsiE [Niabella soli DSM 19437]
MPKKMLLLLCCFIFFAGRGFCAVDTTSYVLSPRLIQVRDLALSEDETNTLTIRDINKMHFEAEKDKSIGISKSTFWVQFSIKNNSASDSLYVLLENPTLNTLFFYTTINGAVTDSLHSGREVAFSQRLERMTNFVYKVRLKPGNTATIFLKIRSPTPMHLPVFIGSGEALYNREATNNMVFGIYLGIVLIMVLYHIFIKFTVADSSYTYYIFFIFFVGAAQVVLRGYGQMYLWKDNPAVGMASINISGVLSGIATALFVKHFLQTRNVAPKMDRVLNLLILGYCVAAIAQFLNYPYVAFNLINFIAAIGSVVALTTGVIAYRKKIRSSVFFLFAFSIFLLSVIVYVARSAGMVPYSLFTNYILEIGSAVQITLLSLALADKINTYRRNQEIARREALRVSKENERLVREQNVILEKEVQNRTEELSQTNEELKGAMKKLQDAQSKLVETEKMASLGQLTAGIAHEINNPINFVTSNIRPLEDDVADLGKIIKMYEALDLSNEIRPQIEQIEEFKKDIDFGYVNEEITTLLSGIREGASRTSEIVKGLRSFARVDEASWKRVNINDGLDSTILLVKNLFPKDFELVKKLGDIPKIECAPGSINQVFMNIITNGIQAIKEQQQTTAMTGRLEITTSEERGYVVISIKDNGPGIPEAVKKKIFEPFFTTKDVGEGTGLGLSIVQGIIDEHNGLIRVDTESGQGTTFVISLPVR